ncbi:YfhO family protein [Loigolactobacillus jiayinensis]|uniref:YfhO family protein n=1 Tax=Loigolactobacillus jiayinensis TaxID=2486016 RepID=A0ABW1RCZ0_9LACO|nr:YfhO family protein [Loigolactobacillus jiayinensis]
MTRLISFTKRHYPLLLSFWLPFLIMGGYFAARQMFPFGHSSLLTVDLGQQYIDFFAFYRDTLLHHPSQVLYSFSKAIGGDMLGVWAYYLFSPFNLLLLLTPGKSLTAGIMLVTLMKYGCAGLSFAWLLKKTDTARDLYLPAFATSYALMGWMVANQLNLIWLDAVVFLPLIILMIERLFHGASYLGYSLMLAAMLIINYYMSYMICLFLVAYILWALARHFESWRQTCGVFLKFAIGSLLGAAAAAVVLLPTLYSLTQSKGQYTVTKIHWKFEYAPIKMISKFVVGAFNFDQMPTGFPNLFVGSLVLCGFLLYFGIRTIPWRERIAAALVTGFLGLSLCYEPLDLLWHGMQFPIWYPYRFSFVVSFWLVWLAAIGLKNLTKLHIPSAIVLVVLLGAGIVYVWINVKNFTYLTQNAIELTLLFSVIAVVLLLFKDSTSPLLPWTILLLVAVEMGTNAILSLNQISYVTQSDYADYTADLVKAVDKTKQHTTTTDFYRLEKTFMRTKNDSMEAGYNSASHFSSTFESRIPNFMGEIGQPAGDGFIAYSNGTLFTDAFLGIKYYLARNDNWVESAARTSNPLLPALTDKPDLSYYNQIDHTKQVTIYKNPYALNLGFAASDQILKAQTNTSYPTVYQSNVMNALTGSQRYSSLFLPQLFATVNYNNVKQRKAPLTQTYRKIDKGKAGTITYTFTPQTNDPYYLSIGSNLNSKAVSFSVNGKAVTQYDTFRDTVLIDLAAAEKGKPVTVTITLNQDEVWLKDFQLYHFDTPTFSRGIRQLQASQWQLTKNKNIHLSGHINITKKHQVMMTTIPATAGWHATVDQKPVKFKRALDTFIAIPLSKGSHTVSLSYWPPYLTMGLIITGATLSVDGLYAYYRYRKRQARKHLF